MHPFALSYVSLVVVPELRFGSLRPFRSLRFLKRTIQEGNEKKEKKESKYFLSVVPLRKGSQEGRSKSKTSFFQYFPVSFAIPLCSPWILKLLPRYSMGQCSVRHSRPSVLQASFAFSVSVFQ